VPLFVATFGLALEVFLRVSKNTKNSRKLEKK
jgi:hypothetical protein